LIDVPQYILTVCRQGDEIRYTVWFAPLNANLSRDVSTEILASPTLTACENFAIFNKLGYLALCCAPGNTGVLRQELGQSHAG
jgi:hypothetical protein